MAFSNTKVFRSPIGNGFILEQHSWNGAGVTTGVLTLDTTDSEGLGVIKEVHMASACDQTTAGVVNAKYTTTGTFTGITLNGFTANDVGYVTVIGKAG